MNTPSLGFNRKKEYKGTIRARKTPKSSAHRISASRLEWESSWPPLNPMENNR